MIGWNILPVEAVGIPGSGYLGMTLLPGRALFFARGAGFDVVLSARRKESGSRTFRSGKLVQIDYRRFPAQGSERPIAPLLDVLASRILAREIDLAGRLDGGPAAGPGTGGDGLQPQAGEDGASAAERIERWTEQDVECLRWKPTADAEPILVKLGPRGRFPLDLLGWSAGVCDGVGRPAESLAPHVQAFVLEQLGRRLFNVPGPVEGRGPEPDARELRHLYVDLGRPESNAGLAAPTAPDGQGKLVLCFDVPSTCDNCCVFCSGRDGSEHGIEHRQAGAGAELERTLKLLRPAIEAASRVDVSMTGRDALAMPDIAALARRIRQEPHIGRLTAVSPGCRLTDERLVTRLKEAGVDSVVMTVLGPEAVIHDRVAGKKGAYRDLLRSIRNLKEAGIDWELNSVIVRQNLRFLPRTIAWAEARGARLRLYAFLSEPEIPDAQVRRCQPKYSSVARILDRHRTLVERVVSSIQYVPVCVLPQWAPPLAGDNSRQSPEPPDVAPAACAGCALFPGRCPSVTRRYLRLFGDGELRSIEG